MRQYEEGIEKVEIEIRGVNEKIDDFRAAKDFVELVITENKTLSEDIKNIMKQQIKQIMANIFRLRQSKPLATEATALNPKAMVKSHSIDEAMSFFITQENKQNHPDDPLYHQNAPLPFTKNDFLEVLKTLEENNIFMFHNI